MNEKLAWETIVDRIVTLLNYYTALVDGGSNPTRYFTFIDDPFIINTLNENALYWLDSLQLYKHFYLTPDKVEELKKKQVPIHIKLRLQEILEELEEFGPDETLLEELIELFSIVYYNY
ncbi:MAG: hypothetical protein QXI58_00050 [Candidatus Micrarchaeia archaeon]